LQEEILVQIYKMWFNKVCWHYWISGIQNRGSVEVELIQRLEKDVRETLPLSHKV